MSLSQGSTEIIGKQEIFTLQFTTPKLMKQNYNYKVANKMYGCGSLQQEPLY